MVIRAPSASRHLRFVRSPRPRAAAKGKRPLPASVSVARACALLSGRRVPAMPMPMPMQHAVKLQSPVSIDGDGGRTRSLVGRDSGRRCGNLAARGSGAFFQLVRCESHTYIDHTCAKQGRGKAEAASLIDRGRTVPTGEREGRYASSADARRA
jgi:hypothetical protein